MHRALVDLRFARRCGRLRRLQVQACCRAGWRPNGRHIPASFDVIHDRFRQCHLPSGSFVADFVAVFHHVIGNDLPPVLQHNLVRARRARKQQDAGQNRQHLWNLNHATAHLPILTRSGDLRRPPCSRMPNVSTLVSCGFVSSWWFLAFFFLRFPARRTLPPANFLRPSTPSRSIRSTSIRSPPRTASSFAKPTRCWLSRTAKSPFSNPSKAALPASSF